MKPENWVRYPGMKELVLKFVAPGLWEKHKSELARKVSLQINDFVVRLEEQFYLNQMKKLNLMF